jgi:hypothetical protein
VRTVRLIEQEPRKFAVIFDTSAYDRVSCTWIRRLKRITTYAVDATQAQRFARARLTWAIYRAPCVATHSE